MDGLQPEGINASGADEGVSGEVGMQVSAARKPVPPEGLRVSAELINT